MENINLYSRKEFSERIGISLEHLRNKELKGELIPLIDQKYTSNQVEEYLNMKDSKISTFAHNILYLMEKHNLSLTNLSKLTSINISTITRMLNGHSKHHRTSPVTRISSIFGYFSFKEISDLKYRHILNHDIIGLPIYSDLFIPSFDNHIKYKVLNKDKQLHDELPHCALRIPQEYQDIFENSQYFIVILSSPILEDTVIYLDSKNNVKLGCVNNIDRSTYSISEIFNMPTKPIKKERVFGVIKSNC